VEINDAMPLKVTRLDTITNLKSLCGFESELQTNLMPFHLDSLLGATLTACAMDCGRNRILGMGKNSAPILSRL